MKYIKGLDVLRAGAVLLVLAEHWGPTFAPFSAPDFFMKVILPDGGFGVNLFFVLSGFLIISNLLKVKASGESSLLIIRNFFIRRSLRIFPIYYLLLLLLLAVSYPDIRAAWEYYFTYTSNFLIFNRNDWGPLGPTWSLSVEEQFYLLSPWIIVFVETRYLKYVFIGFISVGVVSSFVALYVQHGISPILPWNCLDAFGVGGLYALIRQDEHASAGFNKLMKRIMPVAVILFFGYKLYPFINHIQYNYHHNFLKRFLESVIAAGLIQYVSEYPAGTIRAKILGNGFLILVGRISYGIYLYHFFIPPLYKFIVRSIGLPVTFLNYYVAMVPELLLLFVISFLSFELVEKRILTLKSRFV